MYERFTDRARKIMQLANQEAQNFNHEYIGTEHVLLGLLTEGSGVAVNVLINLDVDLAKLRRDIDWQMEKGPATTLIVKKLPQTPSAKKVIEYAMEEARLLNHNYVGSEHILLGLLRETEGIAVKALDEQGVQLEEVRQELIRIQGGRKPPAPVSPPEWFADVLVRPPDLELLRRRVAALSPRRGEVEDLPPDLVATAAELDQEIRRITLAKEKAVADQEFDKAVSFRDQADKLRRKRMRLVGEWIANRQVDPAWLAANEGAVLKLARDINAIRLWKLLPELADRLEQAGCTDAALIDHCRHPGEHSSRCWAVDLLLAKASAP